MRCSRVPSPSGHLWTPCWWRSKATVFPHRSVVVARCNSSKKAGRKLKNSPITAPTGRHYSCAAYLHELVASCFNQVVTNLESFWNGRNWKEKREFIDQGQWVMWQNDGVMNALICGIDHCHKLGLGFETWKSATGRNEIILENSRFWFRLPRLTKTVLVAMKLMSIAADTLPPLIWLPIITIFLI